MKTKNTLALILTSIALISIISPIFAADTITAGDFKLESWAKTIDFFNYARTYAEDNGLTRPPDAWHAYLYMTYINTRGLQVLYAGLDNITFNDVITFRIPMQSFIMHYKTNNNSRDVILANTFLMLLAFNETTNTIYPNSPDMNDTLWASFSMGFDLTQLNATLPALSSKTTLLPLTHTDDNHWSWGMKYTNLTAYWWRTFINPDDPHYGENWPTAITVYDELTFTYNLTINPTNHTATITENHTIGRMRNLLLYVAPFIWVHYNSTGAYLGHIPLSGQPNIYQFLQKYNVKMSIIDYQTSVLLDRETISKTAQNQQLTNNTEVPITNTTIGTYTDDGEKISQADFNTKKTYKLYNYTQDQTEQTYETYNSTARTAKVIGFTGNAGLFAYHIGLTKFLPLLVLNVAMPAQLRTKCISTIANMSKANYLYIIAYPTYSGFRIEQDPEITIYLALETPPNGLGILLIAGIAAIAVASVILIRRRKPKQPEQAMPQTTTMQPQ